MMSKKLVYGSIFFTACSFQYELPKDDPSFSDPNFVNLRIEPALYENTCNGFLNGNVLTIPNFPKNRGPHPSFCKSNLMLSSSFDKTKKINGRFLKLDIDYLSKNHMEVVNQNGWQVNQSEWALYSDVFKIVASTKQFNYVIGSIGGYDTFTDPKKHFVGFFKIQFDSDEEKLESIDINFSSLYSHSAGYDSDAKPLIRSEFFTKPTTLTINSVQIVDHP